MKAILCLLLAAVCAASGQSSAAPKWYQLDVKTVAAVFDGHGATVLFDAKEVVAVSRILSPDEIAPENKAALAPAEKYFVLPLSSGYCAIAPMVAGKWVEPSDPKLVKEVSGWVSFDRENKDSFTKSEEVVAADAAAFAKLPAESTTRYRKQKAERDAKAKAAADLATQYEIAKSVESLRQTLRNIDLRPKKK